MATMEAFTTTSKTALRFTPARRLIGFMLLGCVTAFCVPRLVDARSSLTTLTLVPTLQQVRNAIDIYWLQHHEHPGRRGELELRQQLLETTNRQGRPGTGPEHRYGPYLDSALIPMNPIEGGNTVRVVDTMPMEPIGLEAWIYCWRTGVWRANSHGETQSGNRFFDL